MKHKAASIGFSYLFGLLCAYFLVSPVVFALCGIFAVSAVVLGCLKKPTATVILLTAAIAMGVFGTLRAVLIEPTKALSGQTVKLSGTVIDKGNAVNDNTSFIIDANVNGIATKLSLYGADSVAEYGDRVYFTAKLKELSDNSVFAEKSYNFTRGVFLEATPEGEMTVEKCGDFLPIKLIRDFSAYIKNRLCRSVDEESGATLSAMFFGDKSRLDYDMSRDIRRAGVSHLTAVSGMHLTLISHIIMLLLNLTPLRVFRRTRFCILTAIILFFLVFFDLSFSVLRAGIMLVAYYGGELFLRRTDTFNSVGLATLIILLISPTACVDIGFLLSITGTLGVGVVAASLTKRLKSHGSLVFTLVSTLCATLCTFPLAGLFFGGISIAGFVVNVLILPFFTVSVVAVLLFTLCGGVIGAFPFVAGLCAKVMNVMIVFFGELRYSWISLDYAFFLPWCVVSVMLVAATFIMFKKRNKTAKAVVAALCALAAMVAAEKWTTLDSTRITVLSDGNDAALLMSYRSSTVIVASEDSEKLLNGIKDYLADNNLDKPRVLSVLNGKNNAIPLYELVGAELMLYPDDAVYSEIDGIMTLTVGDGTAAVDFGDYSITVTGIKQNAEPSELIIRYGYSKTVGDNQCAYPIYASNRTERGINAFRESVVFIADRYGRLSRVDNGIDLPFIAEN